MKPVLGRIALALLTLGGVAVAVFLLLRLLPGDVVTHLVGPDSGASPERRAALRRLFGLDDSLPVQLQRWLWGLLRGDLGVSLRTGRPIALDLGERLPVTAELTALSGLCALGLGLPLALLAVRRPGKALDQALCGLCALGAAMPGFWLALLLVLLLSLHLMWLPPAGYVPLRDSLQRHLLHLVLPALTLGLLFGAAVFRTARSALLEVLSQDYIRTARAKGLPERAVLLRHGLRAAATPIVTLTGLQVGQLLGGAVIIEQVFALPGLGRFVLEGLQLRDYPVVQGATLLITALVIGTSLLCDVVCAALDPRLRHG